MQNVTFLKTGDATWASRSGKTERRRHIEAGDTQILRVERPEDGPGEYELWDGNWSIRVPASVVRIEDGTDQTATTKKLADVPTRVSDLGSLVADVAAAEKECPLAGTLFRRLWAIREIIL